LGRSVTGWSIQTLNSAARSPISNRMYIINFANLT
jgi:hypothetical protein